MTQPSRMFWFLLFAATCLLFAQSAQAQWVYAISPDSSVVSVIDPSHDTVARTIPIPTPFSPSAIAITPDGNFAYVVNNCTQADRTSGVPGSVAVLDLVNNVFLQFVPVGNCPNGVAVGATANGVKAYVSNGPGSVSVIDVATNTVPTTIMTGVPPTGVALSPDGKTLYVASNSAYAVVSTATNQILNGVPGCLATATCTFATYIAVDPGNRPWFSGGADVTVGGNSFFVDCTSGPIAFALGRAFILDIECPAIYDATGSVIGSRVAFNNINFENSTYPNLIATSSDGSRGYVAGFLSTGSFSGAEATAVMNGNSVASVNVTFPGLGYSTGAPAVQFYSRDVDAQGYTQTGPLGSVSSISLSVTGSGYLQPPLVQFFCTDSPAQCANVVPATAVATISNGSVASVAITSGGSGYIKPPQIFFIRQGFTPAQALASVSNGSVVSITVTNPGSGYGQPPMVEFACGVATADCGAGLMSFSPASDSQIGTIPLVGAQAQGVAVGPTPAFNTPVSSTPGAPVPVTLSNAPITVNFQSGVTQAGFTGAVISTTGPSLQPNFQLSNPSVYYNILTTAVYPAGSTIQVCITAQGVTTNSRLVHFVNGSPVDITSQPVTPPTICGTTSSLSPFAIEEPTAPTLTQSTTGLSISPNPAQAGQTVTLTAGVNSSTGTGTGAGTGTGTGTGGPTPTGSVTFFDGTMVLASPVILPTGGGPATLMISALSAGTHNITAQYSGDTNYAGSTSNSIAEVVNLNIVAIALISSPNPSAAGQSITFLAAISSTFAPGQGVPPPGGSVTFLDGGAPLAPPVSLTTGGTGSTAGSATLMISTLAAGTHNITAQYSGDNNYASSTPYSNSITQIVNKTQTVVGLSVSASSATAGQPITFTSAVSVNGTGSGVPGVQPPSGLVTFLDNGTSLGPGLPLPTNNSGPVMFTTSSLTPGLHNITAQYSGDADYNGSASNTVQITITNPATTTILVSSSNPSVYGQAVTFTATVASGLGTPSGSVNFFDGATSLGSTTLGSTGMTSLTTSSLGAGTHSITVSYSPTGGFLPSASSVLTETIKPAPLIITANSGSRPYGANNPVLAPPLIAGIQNGDAISSSYSISATPASPVGNYPVSPMAVGAPSALSNYSISLVNGTLAVAPENTSLAISFSAASIIVGQSAVATVTLTAPDMVIPIDPSVLTPITLTSPVISDILSNNGTCTPVSSATSGVASCTITVTAVEPNGRTLLATFPGSADLAASNSSASNTGNLIVTAALQSQQVCIASDLRNVAVPGGSTLWFNSIFKVRDVTKQLIHISFYKSNVQFQYMDPAGNSVTVNQALPDAQITIDPNATVASTSFDAINNVWMTTIPWDLDDNTFLTGMPWLVPSAGLPADVEPVTVCGTFASDVANVDIGWRWAAAAYSSFGVNTALGVKPMNTDHDNPPANRDNAGTPENFKQFVISGARGKGGSNYTGTYTGAKEIE